MSGPQVLYRLLLSAYPRSFRRRYGEMVLTDFDQLHRATASREGFRGVLSLWLRTIPQVLRDGLDERGVPQDPIPSGNPFRRVAERGRWFEQTLQDIRYGARNLVRNPGFAAVAIATIAIGMAANATIFGMTYALLFAELPYGDDGDLVVIWSTDSERGVSLNSTSVADWADLRERTESFEDIAFSTSWDVNLTGREEPLALTGYSVSPNTFEMLRVEPAFGRSFGPDDGGVGSDRVVILSWRLWQRLGADREIAGTTMLLNELEHTVIGIMPEGFEYPQLQFRGDLWKPASLTVEQLAQSRSLRNGLQFGRLAAGVDIETANAELAGIMAQLAEVYPESNEGVGAHAVMLREQISSVMAPAVAVLLVTVGFVLLICCVNVANLFLARGATRQGEFAIRKSLGASRLRVVRQLLTESLIVAGAGGVLGYIGSKIAGPLMVASLPDFVFETSTVVTQAGPEPVVLLVTFAVAAMAGIIFGLAPALRASRSDLGGVMRANSGSVGNMGDRGRLGSLLLVAEVAVSVVLLIGAGLMVKGFAGLLQKDPGFEADGVLTIELALNGPRYETEEARRAFYREAIVEIEALQGVETAGASSLLPLTFRGNRTGSLEVDGMKDQNERSPSVGQRTVTAGYLRAMGASLLQGRLLEPADRADAPRVAIVNEALLRHLPEGDPLGRRISVGGGELMTIVGVIRNFQHNTLLDPPGPAYFMPYEQSSARARMYIAIKAAGPSPADLALEVRDAVWRVDPAIPIDSVRTLDKIVDDSLVVVRLPTTLMAVFGVTALVLAAVGLYGLLAYRVERRSRELGIRVALGAAPGQVLRLVLWRGMALTGLGLLMGMAVAVPLGRLLAAVLEGVNASEPLVYLGVPMLLLVVTVVATLVPARRALALDPAISLRAE